MVIAIKNRYDQRRFNQKVLRELAKIKICEN